MTLYAETIAWLEKEAGDPASKTKRVRLLEQIIRPLPEPAWAADYMLGYLEQALADFEKDWGGCNLTPDFQRGHVWTREQQERFVEALLRDALPVSALLIQFNCPHWQNYNYDGELPREVQCVDGLQRLTAIRKFLAGEIRAFGLSANALSGTRFDVRRSLYRLRFAMHTFQTKAELLQYYLDVNDGGTPHTEEELERVRAMMRAAV